MPEVYSNETPDEEEKIVVDQTGGVEHRERVVQDTAGASRMAAYRISQVIWLLFGILDGLIALRIILKFIAANPANPFAYFIYSFTEIFLWPFNGLTLTPSFGGMVLEISSLIAMIIYWLIAWVLVKIVWLALYRNSTTVVQTYDSDRRV